jgi:hypothetical protein
LKKRFMVTLSAAALIAIGAPASAQLIPIGPLPVVDTAAEPVWLKTLIQDISSAASLKTIMQTEIQNVIPTTFPWGITRQNPVQLAPILTEAVAQLDVYNAQIQKNTGAPPAPNQALQIAQAGMANLPADEADLTNAQDASDACEGDLCAQQAQHRFSQLSVTQQIEAKQFAEAQYIQQKKDEAAALAWMTNANTVSHEIDNGQ